MAGLVVRVLVVYGSKRGGTAELADVVAEALRGHGIEADARPAREVRDIASYDAVVVGGALYANHWHRDARRFVRRFVHELSERPVWLFSSGPLDGSAEEQDLAPVPQVVDAMGWIGARGHVTFGGRLAEDASGLVAGRMARRVAGDYRDDDHVARWVARIADALRGASAGTG